MTNHDLFAVFLGDFDGFFERGNLEYYSLYGRKNSNKEYVNKDIIFYRNNIFWQWLYILAKIIILTIIMFLQKYFI